LAKLFLVRSFVKKFLSSVYSIDRLLVLSDRKSFLALHFWWFCGVLCATIGAIAWYVSDWHGRLPGGSSRSGMTFGIVAAVIIFFECSLWLRRTRLFRTSRRLSNAQTWMKAHLWLGLLSLPLALMHSGFQLGGTFTTTLGVTFLVVIASGMYGLIVQNILPRMLVDLVPDETIHSQIGEVSRQLALEAWRISSLHGMAELPAERREKLGVAMDSSGERAILGAARRVGTIIERSPHPERDLPFTRATAGPAAALKAALEQEIEPFLLTGRSPGGWLTTAQRIEWYFEELRRQIGSAEAHPAIEAIAQLCQRRRQFNLQRKLHFWLHGWLAAHLPLSAALLVLLLGHIYFALRYH